MSTPHEVSARLGCVCLLGLLAMAADSTLAQSSSPRSIGGYGEIHANVVEGDGKDQADIHRAVVYLGYAYRDWLRLCAEADYQFKDNATAAGLPDQFNLGMGWVF